MTALSLNAMFKTMPQHYGYRTPSLLIDGSNYETANTDFITSNDAKWTVDKKGDGSAKDTEVNITVKADKDSGVATCCRNWPMLTARLRLACLCL